jgi:copper chaperone CopZ
MAGRIVAAVLVFVILGGCAQQRAVRPENNIQPARDPSPGPVERPGERPREAVIWVKGLGCPLCAQEVKKELWAVPGVGQIDINYEAESATVAFSSSRAPTRGQLEAAIQKTGYPLTKIEMR